MTPWLANDFEALWGSLSHSVQCLTCYAARFYDDHDGWDVLAYFQLSPDDIDQAWEKVTREPHVDMDAIVLLELFRHHEPRVRRLAFSMVRPLKESRVPYDVV